MLYILYYNIYYYIYNKNIIYNINDNYISIT